MKKRYLLFLFLIMCFAIPVKANASESPKTVVKNYFNAAKKLDYKNVNKYAYDDKTKIDKETYTYFPNMKKYIKKYNKKMKVKILKQKIKGKKATVTVKATYTDSEDIMGSFIVVAIVYVMSEENANKPEKQQCKELDKLFQNCVISCGKRHTTTQNYNIKLRKKNGKWLIDDKNAYKIATAGLYTEL